MRWWLPGVLVVLAIYLLIWLRLRAWARQSRREEEALAKAEWLDRNYRSITDEDGEGR